MKAFHLSAPRVVRSIDGGLLSPHHHVTETHFLCPSIVLQRVLWLVYANAQMVCLRSIDRRHGERDSRPGNDISREDWQHLEPSQSLRQSVGAANFLHCVPVPRPTLAEAPCTATASRPHPAERHSLHGWAPTPGPSHRPLGFDSGLAPAFSTSENILLGMKRAPLSRHAHLPGSWQGAG
jgi:hypothetical protein